MSSLELYYFFFAAAVMSSWGFNSLERAGSTNTYLLNPAGERRLSYARFPAVSQALSQRIRPLRKKFPPKFLRFGLSIFPVSYTHLEVYKRQMLRSLEATPAHGRKTARKRAKTDRARRTAPPPVQALWEVFPPMIYKKMP